MYRSLGFLLAASLRLPVRVLPEQPTPAQERFDLARFRVEKLCQDLRVVTLPRQPWFQRVDILGEHIFDHMPALSTLDARRRYRRSDK
jgi:hypothetical protein